MHHVKRRCVGYLLFIGMLITTSPLLAAAAATVEFVWGTAYAVSISGEKRELEKGSGIDVGDTVVSETARVQLRFTDGGFVSLMPRSEFRVNAYSYSGKPDGTENISMTLLKGGLRTISGLIGKAIQSAYEMKTSVATIGIRGTEYTIVYGQSVTGTVAEGRIAVCNSAGCIEVAQDQSYYVIDDKTKPSYTNKAALLPPPQPGTGGGIGGETRGGNAFGHDKNGNAFGHDKNDNAFGRDKNNNAFEHDKNGHAFGHDKIGKPRL